MRHEDLRRRVASIVRACDAALVAADAQPLTEDQRESLMATLIVLYEKAKSGGQSTPRIVDAYDESLASIDARSLTEEQRDAIDRFFNVLYEKAKDRQEEQDMKPPVVG